MAETRVHPRQPHCRRWALSLTLLLLVGVAGVAGCGSDDEPLPISLRLVNEAGEVVSTAEVFVFMPPESTSEAAGSFSQPKGLLTRPGGPEGHRVVVQAPGYRTEEVLDWKEDRTLVLRPGFLVQIRVEGGRSHVELPHHLVFSLVPAPPGETVLPDPERQKILELMTLDGPLEEGEPDLPRASVGLAVVATAAGRGIRVPMDGRYLVRWGIFDPAEGVWFSPDEARAFPIAVDDDDRAQIFEIPITQDQVDRAKAELVRRAEDIDDR